MRWLRSLFGRKRHAPQVVGRPYARMLAAMRAKDPELFKQIGPMRVSRGIAVWRERYPEDFK